MTDSNAIHSTITKQPEPTKFSNLESKAASKDEGFMVAMESDIRAGLVLPLRVLAYEDSDGNTQMTWTPAEDLFAGLAIAPDAEVVGRINAALNALTDKAMSAR